MNTQQENELITERLLGHKLISRSPDNGSAVWDNSYSTFTTPAFTDWQGAGLILDALAAQTIAVESVTPSLWACRIFKSCAFAHGKTGPLAVRSAALDYLRARE